MNNIIQLVAQKVKREIEENLIKVIEGNTDLDHIVDSVGEMVNSIGIDTISAIIGELNNIIKDTPERKGKYYVHKRKVKRSIITRFGELEYERTYFRSVKENRYVHILDEILGIEKYERIEANLKGNILEKSTDVSYQKAAELSTPVALTRESVKRTIRENGRIDNLELEIKEKNRNKEVETIYIEADEDHVPMQRGKNKIMKLIYIYDDKKAINKGRTKLENVRYFTGDMESEDLWTEVATYLDEAYDIDKVKNIYIAGDGASWIKGGTKIIKDSKFVLDHYHLSKYIKALTGHLNNLENPVKIDAPLWESIRAGNKKLTIELINYAIEETPSEKKKEVMRKSKYYILNNWEGIINLFGEEKYRCSAEGHISHILSSRISSRPMGWSIIGADEMARMRAYKANGGNIKEYYRKLRAKRKKEERIIELDKKVVKDIKKTYNTVDPDMMIDIPYSYRTDGKWLKNMINCSGF